METKSEDGQQAYTASILKEIGKENKARIPQTYTQLQPLSGEQEQAANRVETDFDARNEHYVNSKVVENMKA